MIEDPELEVAEARLDDRRVAVGLPAMRCIASCARPASRILTSSALSASGRHTLRNPPTSPSPSTLIMVNPPGPSTGTPSIDRPKMTPASMVCFGPLVAVGRAARHSKMRHLPDVASLMSTSWLRSRKPRGDLRRLVVVEIEGLGLRPPYRS